MTRSNALPLLLAAAFLTAGCSNEGGLGVDPDGNAIIFSVSSPSASSAGGGGSSSANADETFTDGENTLTIASVAVVLGELELERTDFVDCETNPDATTCGDFKVGPLWIDVPLGGTTREFAIDVDPGNYNVVEIEIYRASSSNPDDADLLAEHPEMDGKSMIIEGTFNGEPFSFSTDLEAYQGYLLEPPITIDETNPTTNVTISLNLGDFFRNEDGGLINPDDANAGGEFESLVESNIQNAIRCFEDEDEDGESN